MGRRRLVACGHAEDEALPQRPERRGMGDPRPAAGPAAGRQGAPAAHPAARGRRRDLLPTADRRAVAVLAGGLPALEHGVRLLRQVARRRHLGAGQRRAAAAGARAAGPRAGAQRRDRGQPVGQDDGKRGERGFDAAKLVKGRKRHLLTDTQGLLLRVVALAADIQDWDGAEGLFLVAKPVCPRLQLVWADSAYGRNGLPEWTQQTCGWRLEVVSRPHDARGFVVVPRRWAVERTIAWICRNRRLSKDYEE